MLSAMTVAEVASRAHQSCVQGLEGERRMFSVWYIMLTVGILQVYAGAIMYFGLNCATAGITGFLPTIIKTFGFSGLLPLWSAKRVSLSSGIANTLAQLLTVPPYTVAAICLCLVSYASDRLQDRGSLTAGSCVLAGIGYV